MNQLYQDAMAIVRERDNPSFFVTFTCNPNWQEITEALPKRSDGQRLSAAECADIVSRVFKLKLDLLCELLYKEGVLGRVIGRIHVVEFQKRGLPHAHVLIILDDEDRPRTAADIDATVCAEIPNPNKDPELFETVVNCMLHGPCAVGKCKESASSPCEKGYPMPFGPHTNFSDKDGHVYTSARTMV